jgi:hypothetical protein
LRPTREARASRRGKSLRLTLAVGFAFGVGYYGLPFVMSL